MAGILDFLTGQSGASPWGALYQDPLAQRQKAAGDLLASMGVSPTAAPQISPFDLPQPPAPAPAAPAFGAGATPFGFAGPGSMNGINPASIIPPAAPQAAPAPAPAPIVAPPAAPAPAAPVNAAADDGEDATPANAAPTSGALPAAAGAPASPAPFSLGGSGIGDRLGASVQSFANTTGGGLLGKLANGVSSLVTGQRTDPTGVALQLQGNADSANARALLSKGVDPATVQAAILGARAGDKTMLTTLINQNFGPDKFQHVMVKDETGAETPGSFDPTTGKYNFGGKQVGADASERGGVVLGPDGKAITIPPGVNRKEFIKRVTEATADAATGKKTEAQAKASSFAARMEQSESQMGKLQNEGLSLYGKGMENVPGGVGNYMQSPKFQQYQQAQSAFITALLRQESGAAINKDEYIRYSREMFPQPGDDASVVQQKAAMRKAAIEQMRGAAGPGYKSPAASASGTVSIGGASIPWSVK